MCVCVYEHNDDDCGSQKKASDVLQLELWAVVSQMMLILGQNPGLQ